MQNLNCKAFIIFNLQIYIEAEMKEKFWCKPTFFRRQIFFCVYMLKKMSFLGDKYMKYYGRTWL